MFEELSKEIDEYIDYNSDTGLFFWKRDVGRKVKKGTPCGSTCKTNGYVKIRFKGRNMAAHRLAWFIVYGYEPRVIDHINGVRDDNRIENIRDVTVTENNRNHKFRSTNTSGYDGVYFRIDRQLWMAQISSNGRNIYLGYHDTAEIAHKIRMAALDAYGYHENHCRR